MNQFLLKSEIKTENDIVFARKRTRDISQFLKLDKQEQTRLATAVSEMARNVFQYAGKGTIDFNCLIQDEKAWLEIVIRDKGPGIAKIKDIMSGRYISPQGMGVGIIGTKNLVDDFAIDTGAEGTTVTLRKVIPQRRSLLSKGEVKSLLDILVTSSSTDPVEEIQKQNQEILLTLAALNEKKEELSRLNQELEETNRGVVALYAELDEKAESLRLANETKTSFLSDMTHEFRSPLNSILSISGFLLEDARAEGSKEREKQISFIIKAAHGLSDLVNDLLDIAKIEAGKVPVRVSTFTVHDLFSTLRGLMRPISSNPEVNLVFEEKGQVLKLQTDEGKVNQMLRNLISNALKYTEKGDIVISARPAGESDVVEFCVSDTGIGIPPESLEAIFSEFVQVENPLQENAKGTGLGLPLTRKLANLLGGTIEVQSKIGEGSLFIIRLPALYQGSSEANYGEKNTHKKIADQVVKKVLVVDDDDFIRQKMKKLLDEKGFDSRLARNGKEGLELAKAWTPDLVILDLVMPEMNGFDFIRLAMLEDKLRNVPVILNTSKDLTPEEQLYLEQVTNLVIKKDEKNVSHIRRVLDELLDNQRKPS